jgi:hypothetical protein
MKTCSKIISTERGSVMLELALVLPLLLILISGIIQFGFILNAKIAVNSASYEGARAATLHVNPEEAAINAVENYAGSSLPGWSLDERLGVKIDVHDNAPGTPVLVEVSYSVPLFFKNIAAVFPGSDSMIDISGTSVMRVEEKE